MDRWVTTGIISGDQAERIRADLATLGPDATAPSASRPVSLVAEGLGYLGGVIVVVGLGLVLGLSWENLTAMGKVGVAAAVTVALAVAGALVPIRRLGPTGARLRAVLWTGASVGVAAAAGLTGSDVLQWRDDDLTLLVASGATAVASASAWAVSRHVLQHLSTVAALLMAAWSGTVMATDSNMWSSLAVWGVGVVWFVLSLPDILPRRSAGVFGSLGATIGGIMMLQEEWGALFALGTVVALVAVAVVRRELPVLGVGSVGTLIVLPFTVDEYFPGVLPAALSLVVGGLALVAIALITARRRRDTPAV